MRCEMPQPCCGAERERLQDQQVERALEQIEFACHQRPVLAGSLRRVQSTIDPSYILES